MRTSRPSPEMLQRQVDDWNRQYPIGTPVRVTKDDGKVTVTKTRSAAWAMGGHTAVVMVDGIAGGYLLSRCVPVEGATL